MSDKSTIEWTDATWNPIRGCTKISPGCKHCYAETFAERFRGVPDHPYEQGFDMRLVPHKLLEPLSWTRSRMIFVNSMSDLFQDRVPEGYIRMAFEVMLAANWHTYQVLTKRAERMSDVVNRLPFDLTRSPHLWLGVSVEDKKYGVPRINALRRTRAAVRFLSVEPLLEDLGELDLCGIDWVIVGGESGFGARPMEKAWVRRIRDQCVERRVAFFFKQWGGVRKKKAGRELEGQIWDELPEISPVAVPSRADIRAAVSRLQRVLDETMRSVSPEIVFQSGSLHAARRVVGREANPSPTEKRMPIKPRQRGTVLQMLADGQSKRVIAEVLGLSVGQVAAVAAHVTMGTYSLPTPSAEAVEGDAPIPDATPQEVNPVNNELSTVQRGADGRDPYENEDVAISPILLGHALDDGHPVFWSPSPSAVSPNPHMLIVGSSGSGKTYTTLCLLAELSKRGLPSIVFDYGQGFAKEALPAEFLEMTDIREIEVARDGVSINPLEILPTDVLGPINVGQRVADTIQRVFPRVGVQQHAILRDAVIEVLEDAAQLRSEPSSWRLPSPSLGALREKLNDYAANKTNPGRRHAASLEAHISSLFVFNTFRHDGSRLSWAELLASDRPTVLQFRGLNRTLERVAIEFLLWSLDSYVNQLGPGSMRGFVVLDEAHNLPMSEGTPVAKLLREGRKFGIGVVLASQQPDDFPRVAYSNTTTKLYFRIGNRCGNVAAQIVGAVVPSVVREMSLRLSHLERGQAVLTEDGRISTVRIVPLADRKWHG